MNRVDYRCLTTEDAAQYEIVYECLDCRKVITVVYSMGHPPIAGFYCEWCNERVVSPECLCGGTDLVRAGSA